MSLPVIDIGPFREDANGQDAVGRQVDDACRDLGFMLIRNHGLDPRVIDDCWQAAGCFFASSPDNRRSAAAPEAGHPYGYHGFASEALAYSLDEATPPDLKETFNVGPLDGAPPGVSADARAFAFSKNHWPPDPPGLRTAFEAYYRALRQLSDHIMEIFAVALGLPQAFFAASHTHAISALRAINYPALESPPPPGQMRAGAHTDYGTLTLLLLQPGEPGLQVHRDGAWIDVVAPAGALVVNIGDMMARWTNDRWVSTLHRVVNPGDDAMRGKARQSLVFFHTPNWDAEIACLPTCVDKSRPARYAPVHAGPHLASKFSKTVL